MDLIACLRSPDDEERDTALAQLIQMGAPAIAALRAELAHPDSDVRPSVMEALASIADSSCADDFHVALEDDDERVRAWAAAGLARIRDPRAIAALIRTFDDQAIDLHGPHTLASSALVEQGPAALPQVMSLLLSPNVFTRERAYWVIANIVTRMDAYKDSWHELSLQLGSYDPDGPAETREKAARKWAEWAAKMQRR